MPDLFDVFRFTIGGIKKEPQAETEPIIGYRAWKLIDGPEGIPLLYSCSQGCCWPPYEPLQAVDAYEPASNPKYLPNGVTLPLSLSQSSVGIYAFNKQELAPSYFGDDHIMGEVYLWGEVIEHEEGYRAQFAYPKELWVKKDFDAAMIVRLEETYGVPVIIKEDLPASISTPHPTTFRSGSSLINSYILEITKECVYDREPLFGVCNRMLFCVPLGQVTHSPLGGRLKGYQQTNMLQAGCLDAPRKLLVKQIRCTFFEDGKPLPVSDRIYWDAYLEFSTFGKTYWRGPAAYAADPLVVLAGTDWSKIPFEHADKILERLTLSLESDMPSNKHGGNAFGLSAGTALIDGVLIDQQQPFCVKISTDNRLERDIDVLVGLIGPGARAVI